MARRVNRRKQSAPPRRLSRIIGFLRPSTYSTSAGAHGTCASTRGDSPGPLDCTLDAPVSRREGQSERGRTRTRLQAPAQLAKRLPAKRPSFGAVISHFTSPPCGPARLALLFGSTASKFVHRLRVPPRQHHPARRPFLSSPRKLLPQSPPSSLAPASALRFSARTTTACSRGQSKCAPEVAPGLSTRRLHTTGRLHLQVLPPTIALPKRASPVS
jgi:hypothetical protein